MSRAELFFLAASIILVACAVSLFLLRTAHADSLSLMTDLKYELNNSDSTEKATGIKTETERAVFSQLYSLDIQKDIFPTLHLNIGGLFDQDSTRSTITDPDGQERTEQLDTSIRPYIDLRFSTPLLRAATGYHKSEIKRSLSTASTGRNFTEEYNANLSYEPVKLPRVDLDFTRYLAYDEPLTNDLRVDTYQLRSRYNYENFRFDYNHTTSDAMNQTAEFKTLTNTDNGAIRFNRTYQQGKVSVNSSVRASRQLVEFSGIGDRLVPTTPTGIIIGRADDLIPETSDPDPGFDLGSIDLLVDLTAPTVQFSFGRDFGLPTEVDTLLIEFEDLKDHLCSDFSWRVFVRDNETETWDEVVPLQQSTNLAEKNFKLSFSQVKKRFIKIVTRQIIDAGVDLFIRNIVGQRTLPQNTSEFLATDWTVDSSVNWKLSDSTSTGYDILYREQRSQPFDDKRTLLNTGARLRHRFNDIFVGNLRAQRSETRDQGEDPSTNYNFSAALAAKYLETFDQSLTYSFNHQNDAENRSSTSNSIFLRNNLDLYQGWSLYLDNGFTWLSSDVGEDTDITFLRVGTNIVPNRRMNFTLTYGVSWNHTAGQPVVCDQNGRLVATWVPTASLSLSADLLFTDEGGKAKNSTAEQRYFINWSPFRDGTLAFALGYSQSQTSEDENVRTLSPTLHWQINQGTLLTLEYSLGKREDQIDIVEFETTSLELRIFY